MGSKKLYIQLILLTAFAAGLYAFVSSDSYSPPKVEKKVELTEEQQAEKWRLHDEAIKAKNIKHAKEYLKSRPQMIEELLEDPESLTTLSGLSMLTHMTWMWSKDCETVGDTSCFKEKRIETLRYHRMFSEMFEQKWAEKSKRKSLKGRLLTLIKYSIHLTDDAKEEKRLKERLLQYYLDLWDSGEQTYEVADGIVTMYSARREWDPETGRQASIPLQNKWIKIRNDIGKPDNFRRSANW